MITENESNLRSGRERNSEPSRNSRINDRKLDLDQNCSKSIPLSEARTRKINFNGSLTFAKTL